jgi:hypothetical protein
MVRCAPITYGVNVHLKQKAISRTLDRAKNFNVIRKKKIIGKCNSITQIIDKNIK